MPTIHVPLPSIPGNFIYIKTVTNHPVGFFNQALYSDHFFMSDAAGGAFNIHDAAVNDFLPNWFRHVFTPLFSTSLNSMGCYMFCNVWTHVQSILISPSWPVSTNGPALGPMFKARVTRVASSASDYFYGRFAWPPIPRAWLDGNEINSTGRAAYASAMIAYMQPWFSQGYTFTPCGWSRKYNTVYPLTDLRPGKYVTHDRKTRQKDVSHQNNYIWPQVP